VKSAGIKLNGWNHPTAQYAVNRFLPMKLPPKILFLFVENAKKILFILKKFLLLLSMKG